MKLALEDCQVWVVAPMSRRWLARRHTGIAARGTRSKSSRVGGYEQGKSTIRTIIGREDAGAMGRQGRVQSVSYHSTVLEKEEA